MTSTGSLHGAVGEHRDPHLNPATHPSGFAFAIRGLDAQTQARVGRISTFRGDITTPAFMPVGTNATVRTLDPDEIRAAGADIILSNTYHLMLRPGVEVIQGAGGLHRFMGWPRPILTDSGGFQIFSLAQRAKVDEDGVVFRSHIDGSAHRLTPENAVDLQVGFGSDIMMPLDHLVGLPAPERRVREAAARTQRWLLRSIEHRSRSEDPSAGALFGICQGGLDRSLRAEQASFLAEQPVDGCAIGGLSVGESKDDMLAVLETVTPRLPPDKPRYLMGVGSPEDLWRAVALGIDMFDCVLPSRIARHGTVFTRFGRIDLHHRRFRAEHRPIQDGCDCRTCQRFTLAYLHHLFRAREMLGMRLATIHNLRFVLREMEVMRDAIADGTFASAARAFLDDFLSGGSDQVAEGVT